MSESEKKKIDRVTPEQLLFAIKMASGFGVAGLVAVGLALAIFVTTAASERSEICDVIENVARGNAQALVIATDRDDRTPEQEASYQQAVEIYLAEVEENLKGCR